jgi:type II secretory ATPase GspE/PulE/Tfp pilus assembly ATPase PilB-like protein
VNENTYSQPNEYGAYLVEERVITADQLTSAAAHAEQASIPFVQSLIELEILSEEQVTRTHAQYHDIPYVCLKDINIDRSVSTMIEPIVARRYGILPIGRKADGTLRIAVIDWNDAVREAAANIAHQHGIRIAPALATEAHVRAGIDEVYAVRAASAVETREPALAGVGAGGAGAMRNSTNDGGAGGGNRPGFPPSNPSSGTIPPRSAVPALVPPGQQAPAKWAAPGVPATTGNRASDVFNSGPPAKSARGAVQQEGIEEAQVDQPIVIQFVNRILADAINKGASDIHFEPRRDRLDIRYRIDGTLHNVDSIRREFQAACTSRVKVMADMNIAERRLPQDGRIAVTIDGRSVDMRVSSLPTQYGESVVLRILDKGATRPNLDQLGFSESNLRMMKSLIRKPHGIFLATGPTGSGKTTTLYAAIQEIHTPEVNIITVEDPIEYDLEGIRQSNVHEKAGLTMARQLRAILRQDPDIIYVGEIRDAETAEIAFRAALTGHLVFSTLHCNDAAGAVTRLLNMDVDPFLVASSVVGVLAQRLVRRVCSRCAQPYTPTEQELSSFGLTPGSPEVQRGKFLIGAGCEVCDYTGYKSRYSVQELMSMDDHIRNLVLQRTPSNKIRKAAIAHGMSSMREDAASKVMQGVTTFEEAAKRVFIEEGDDEPAHVY